MDRNRTVVNKSIKSIKELAAPFKNIDKIDVHGVMQLLKANATLDVKVKLLSMLAAYLMSNDADRDMVIRSNHIYDNVSAVLADSPPRKAAVALNFLSALLYADEERSRKNLAPYARNIIRASGCLATMCDLFTNCMMHQDTWRALCRSLAEACRGVEANQSYCTHLVPMCIQRCGQRNWDAFSVLQSLLQNHKRNIQLFFENNGSSLFARDYLQHENCLELLATIVQSSDQAYYHIKLAHISKHLQEFLRFYGPQSQIGQWATIILYHTRSKVSGQSFTGINMIEQTNASVLDDNKAASNNDTTVFFQNVMKEIIHWEPKGDLAQMQNFLAGDSRTLNSWIPTKHTYKQPPSQNNNTNFLVHMEKVIKSRDDLEMSAKHLKSHKGNELSFSFLQMKDKEANCKPFLNKPVANSDKDFLSVRSGDSSRNASTQIDTDFFESNVHSDISEVLQNMISFNEFKPIYVSTPKHMKRNPIIPQTKRSNQSVCKSVLKPIRNCSQKYRIETRTRIAKQMQDQKGRNNNSEIKNRSVSARFFRAVNESCNTLVKTVKNIFGSNKHEIKEATERTETSNNAPSCSYSFTNYMQKRDAILGDKTDQNLITDTRADNLSLETSNPCKTCNDTEVLRNKLANNDNLRHTVNKLKVGINLYGCDFKKISRTMWPHDAYMTPIILYNLYRKLLTK